jgi:MSHA biogenesis protein MshK
VFRTALLAVLLLASLPAGAEDELPVRDPMRPFGRDGAGGVAAAPAPRFTLTGVVISPSRRVAILNGRPYKQGDSIDGAEIVAVESHAVRLNDGGNELVIPLKAAAKSRQPVTQGDTVP